MIVDSLGIPHPGRSRSLLAQREIALNGWMQVPTSVPTTPL